jgi:hypothetical protein
MLGLSPHPGVSYLFQNLAHADDATALGGAVPGEPRSPPPCRTPALGELGLKADSKFKVRKSTIPVTVATW